MITLQWLYVFAGAVFAGFAIGSIVLIQSTLAGYGYILSPLELALWAIPTALAATLIHSFRLLRLDRRLRRRRK